jgi:Cft2 family RNA processing exonuclease
VLRGREARDETIAVNGSLNEAAKSYVRAIALVTNERERSYLERRLREVESLQSQSNSYRQRPTIWISRVVRI